MNKDLIWVIIGMLLQSVVLFLFMLFFSNNTLVNNVSLNTIDVKRLQLEVKEWKQMTKNQNVMITQTLLPAYGKYISKRSSGKSKKKKD